MSELSKADRELFEFMKEFAERVLKGEHPVWQCKFTNDEFWSDAKHSHYPNFMSGISYRFAKKKITINGVEIVAPRLSSTDCSEESTVFSIDDTLWSESPIPEHHATAGTFVFDNIEDLKAFREAMLKAIGE